MKLPINKIKTLSEEKKITRRSWLKGVVAVAGAAAASTLAARAASAAMAAGDQPKVKAEGRNLSKVARLEPVGCTDCDRCMPCGYGVDIPGNFAFYNEKLATGAIPDVDKLEEQIGSPEAQREATRFLRDYNHAVADPHQAQRCIHCFHCVMECPEKIAIVNELAAITALADRLRDIESTDI